LEAAVTSAVLPAIPRSTEPNLMGVDRWAPPLSEAVVEPPAGKHSPEPGLEPYV